MDQTLDLLKGTLDVLILRTCAGDPMHGYGISQWIRDRTGGALQVQDAALYQALRRLEAKGWLAAEWGVSENNRRARYYSLTEPGRAQLRAEASAWRRYAAAVFQVLEPVPES
ncbi:MAG TPA: PadR family transcriptional regulator [Longimicrobium sp.]|jgi:transcriptional regulator|nr:PadR family transcriptional regulator [Longimicrobium sp.]